MVRWSRSPVLFLLLAHGLTVFACGTGDNDGPGPVGGNNANHDNNGTNAGTGNNATNNGTNNTPTNNGTANNNMGACDAVECDPDRKCVKGVCVKEELKVACQEVNDLGVLDITQTATAMGDTEGYADGLDTDCQVDDGNSGPENAFKFQVSADASVDVALTSSAQLDWVVEVREDDCGDAAPVAICSDPETFQFQAVAGKDYYVIVEPGQGIDTGAFQLDFSFEEIDCFPFGSWSCDGDQRVQCRADGELALDCAAGCSNEICDGDTCANAMEVTASMSWSGETRAYESNLDFSNSDGSCHTTLMTGFPTPGPELVLFLPGLTAGQAVSVDASEDVGDDSDNAIFVLDTCADDMGCVAAVDLGEKLTWDVESDGDYYVVIDKRTTSAHAFNYAIDIQ